MILSYVRRICFKTLLVFPPTDVDLEVHLEFMSICRATYTGTENEAAIAEYIQLLYINY